MIARKLTLAALGALTLLAAAPAAHADWDGYHNGWRERAWHERMERERYWRERQREHRWHEYHRYDPRY